MSSLPTLISAGRRGARIALGLIGTYVVGATLHAQSVTPSAPKPAAAPATAPAPGEVVALSAFEVLAEKDNSYGALNSASITRFNVELENMPVSADIFTETFMKDIAATSVEEVIQGYSAGAGYADGSDNGASTGANNQPGDRNGNAYIQIRGMHTPVMQRDSFMPVGAFGNPGSTAVGRTDNFDLERVEVINGPQALLYGGGGAGGVINVTSKQARFGSNPRFFGNARGSALYRIDHIGSKRGEIDLGFGNRWFAARFAFLRESQKSRRVNIGSRTNGQYAQFAFRLFQDTIPTTIRVSGSMTMNDRWLPRTATLNAPGDARHNLSLRYILATGQQGATNPVTGAPYARGAILNGKLNWNNVDSFAAGTQHQEPITNDFVSVTSETKWSNWLTTQVAAGYDEYTSRRINPGFTFFAPRSGANNTDDWAAGLTPQDSWQPARTKGGRIAALITKDFFQGRAKTQTLIGADYIRTEFAQHAYRWYRADDNWNTIIAPGSTITSANSGRTILNQVLWPINDGSVPYPFPEFNAALDRGRINGVNYVRELQNQPQASLVTPANPLGTPFTSGNFILTKLLNRGFYGVNHTRWLDGKLNTLVGVRQGDYVSDRFQHPTGGVARYLTETSELNFNVGVDYSINRWLHPYINYSDSVQPPYVANRTDPHNNPPTSAHGIGGEIGLKWNNASRTLSGSLAYYKTSSEGDLYAIDGTIRDDINPAGLNGGGGNNYVSIDRVTRGLEMRFTAAPTRNWRLRFSAATTDGEIGTTKSYTQRYNDQFYTNASGQVTYRNGTVVYVNGGAATAAQATVVPSTTPGAVPLTVNLLSTPASSNFYYANPDSTSGRIQPGTIAAQILSGTNNNAALIANGPILTGATDLPISALQLNKSLAGIVTPGEIVATRVGDKTTGYPEYSMNLTSNYTFAGEHLLKGVNVGGSLSLAWKNRAYYYYAEPVTAANSLTLRRTLLYTPDTQMVNVFIGYTRRIGRIDWSTQLNVANLLNRYDVRLLPNATTGFNQVNNVGATWYQQPRAFMWTNTVKF